MSGWSLVFWIVVASLIVEAIKRPFNYGLSWFWEEYRSWHFRYRIHSNRWEIRGGKWVRRKK